ncbi:MAG: hypothetical protein Tsb0021_08200 [Chlamydiales bacterium]
MKYFFQISFSQILLLILPQFLFPDPSSGTWNKSLKCYEEALKQVSDCQSNPGELLKHYKRLACITYHQKQFKETFKWLEKMEHSKDPNDIFFRGWYLRECGYYHQAIECFTALASNQFQTIPSTHIYLADLYSLTGSVHEAMQELQHIEDETSVSVDQFCKGLIYLKLGRFNEALKIAKNDFYGSNILQALIYLEQKDFNRALELLESSSIEVGSRIERLFYYALGYCYMGLGRLQEAKQVFLQLNEKQDSLASRISLAESYLRENNAANLDMTKALLKPYADFNLKALEVLTMIDSDKESFRNYYDHYLEMHRNEPNKLGHAYFSFASQLFVRAQLELGEKKQSLCQESGRFFQKASECLLFKDKELYERSCINSCLACINSDYFESILSGLEKAEQLVTVNAVKGGFLKGLAEWKLKRYAEATSSWKKIMHESSEALYSLAALTFEQQNYEEAITLFMNYAEQFPTELNAGEALYFASVAMEKISPQNPQIIRTREKIWQHYPVSCYADWSYFYHFPLKEYLKGAAESLSHLKKMVDIFPDSYFNIEGFFILGLIEFQSHRWDRALQAFYKSASFFDSLYSRQKIPSDLLEHFTIIRFRSFLERAKINMEIAKTSEGSKRIIYSLNAINLINTIKKLELLTEPQHVGRFHVYHDEVTLLLAEALKESSQIHQAEEVLTTLIKNYQNKNISRGYFIAKAFYELGLLKKLQKQIHQALDCFQHAWEAAATNLFPPDQHIELLIQISNCYQEIGDFDEAIVVLSQAINRSVISSQRIKAMYLRAELYETLGKTELAERQLEAVISKNGEWAQKAQEKLDRLKLNSKT